MKDGFIMSKKTLLDVDQLLEIIRLRDQDGLSNRAIAKVLSCAPGTIDNFFNQKTYTEFWTAHNDKPLMGGSNVDPIEKRLIHKGKKVIILTSVQNNTHVHGKFLQTLKQCMEHRDADLMVGTFSYAKTMFQKSTKGDGWYAPAIRDYIVDKPIQLAEGLVFCGELNINPTAKNPLAGLAGYASGNSFIVPATKQALETVPTQKHKDPTFMYSTGAVSQRNYIQRLAGQKAEFHHIFGALIVEIDERGKWFVRQINAESDTGNFYDLGTYYTPDGWTENHKLAGMNPGDIHTNQIEPAIAAATFGIDVIKGERGRLSFKKGDHLDSIVDTLLPEYIMAQDILDFKVRNHHNRDNPHFKFKQFIEEDESIEVELSNVARLLSAMEREECTPVVVSSNHDRALLRYIVDNVRNWSDDPANAEFFLRTQLAAYEHMRLRKDFDPVEWSITKLGNERLKTRFLKVDEEFYIAGISCEHHGDIGPNGARGSLNGFVKLGIKMCIGHSHTAGIKGGVYQSGITCSKSPDYAKGPSSWSWSHTLIYPNGKRTIVTMYIDENGKAHWRG